METEVGNNKFVSSFVLNDVIEWFLNFFNLLFVLVIKVGDLFCEFFIYVFLV